jgi:predicted dehydrogenase
MVMSKTLKIGFVGAGGIARYQMSMLKKIDGVEIVGLADVNKSALDLAAKETNGAKVFSDWKELLAMPGLDAVSVCTPNKLHCEPTVLALKAGKHVLVEKPMAMNAAEAGKMCEAAARAKKILQIAFQWRFTPVAQMLRRQVHSGALGDVLYVRVQALRRRGIPNWGVFGRKELQGGGPMIDIGVHLLEMAHYVIGAPKPVSAAGSCYTYLGNKGSDTMCPWPNWDYKTYSVEDLAVGFLKFETGATLVIESSFVAHIEKDVYGIQIMGTKGGATSDPPRIFTDANGYMMNMEPTYMGQQDGFDYKMRHFVECIRNGIKCQAPGEDGWMVQKMLDGIYRASDLGKEIKIA